MSAYATPVAQELARGLIDAERKRWKAVAEELAHQVEQMKGLFDDEDGTIQAALDEFYEAQKVSFDTIMAKIRTEGV